MTITESNLASHIIKNTQSEIGSVHFFKHIAVLEFKEGVHVDLTSARPTLHSIIEYFGYTKPFGLISNKVHSYSVALLDIKDFRQALPNLKSYGIVSYNNAGRMNARIESSFCEWKDICFNNLYEGLDVTYKKVKTNANISLN